MMWSAVCSGSPHSHAALSARHHFFMEALYRPTPFRSLFRVIQCFRLRPSPLTPSPGSDTWRCIRAGSGCFPLLLPRCRNPCILRPVLRDDTCHLLGLLVVRFTGLEYAWRQFIICRVVQHVPVVLHCFPCQGKGSYFPP